MSGAPTPSGVRILPAGVGRGAIVETSRYRLRLNVDRPYALLEDADGTPWADLCLAWAIDRVGAPDETLALADPVVVAATETLVELRLDATSTAWTRRSLHLRCTADELAAWCEVEGQGRVADVRAFGGTWLGVPVRGTGTLRSGGFHRSVFTAEPGPLDRFAVPAGRAVAVDVVGGSWPGRGHWFFTPPPLVLALGRQEAIPGEVPDGPWLGIGLGVSAAEATFTGLHLDVEEEAFSLRLAYEGHQAVDGSWRTPELRLRPGQPDIDAVIAADREALVADGSVRVPDLRGRPTWWSEPIFCGWGAQSALGHRDAGPDGVPVPAARYSTQSDYDRFLVELDNAGLDPGIVVIDDKWERRYGSGEADPDRWPGLAGWIAGQHGRGRRVLLWWKAWDPEALPPEACIRRPDGVPIAADPEHPEAIASLTAAVARMLGPGGYGADGLKVDFTAQTPSGSSLLHHGPSWGVALLHAALRRLYVAVKAVRPDALVITHAVDPRFADATDMVRLNDALRLSDPRPYPPVVPQMRFRARIARAAMPWHPIDTDDWAMPDLATWRAYQAAKADLGVPALYHTSHIDQSGEALTSADHDTVRALWSRFRAQPSRPTDTTSQGPDVQP